METGTKISGVAHGVLLCAAMFGAPIFSSDSEKTIKVSEVSLISSDEFAAVYSGSTQSIPEETPQVQPMPVEPEPEVAPTPEDPEPVGEVEVIEPAPEAEIEEVGEVTPEAIEGVAPKQAEVISNENVDAPEEPVETDTKVAVAETPTPSEDVQPEEPKEVIEPAAPKETTTEIVTEAEEKVSDLAPARTARPKGRPKGLKLAEKEPDPKPDPQTPKESIEDQIALDIAKAIAEANAEAATSQPAPVSGPPLSGSEMSGLVFAIQQCWNVPVGLQNDDSNVVTLGISLTKDGRLAEEPRRVAPLSGSASGILQAYEAARRALIRCQPYDMPADKYETWREMEIVFNPRNMVLR